MQFVLKRNVMNAFCSWFVMTSCHSHANTRHHGYPCMHVVYERSLAVCMRVCLCLCVLDACARMGVYMCMCACV